MEWLTYLLKVSACTALFYAFYHLCLQRLTFFNISRIYLLSTLILSFIIPVLQLKVERPAEYSNQFKEETTVFTGNFADLQQAAVGPNPVPKPFDVAVSVNWLDVLFISYWLIATVMLAVFVFQVLQLLQHARHVSRKVGRLKVVFKPEGFTNCSFLNYVFVNHQELSDEEMAVILQHEQVHEYEADKETSMATGNTPYANVLLR